ESLRAGTRGNRFGEVLWCPACAALRPQVRAATLPPTQQAPVSQSVHHSVTPPQQRARSLIKNRSNKLLFRSTPLYRACVVIYEKLGMFEEALQLALQVDLEYAAVVVEDAKAAGAPDNQI